MRKSLIFHKIMLIFAVRKLFINFNFNQSEDGKNKDSFYYA